MKVVHLSTSDRGGAGIAASRLHLALLEMGIDSHFLTLHKFTSNIPKHSKFEVGAGRTFPFIKNGIAKIKRRLKYYNFYATPLERLSQLHLKNRVLGLEHFSFPFSEYNIAEHPMVVDADIIHLHWVSDGFLDYENFFKNCKKKFVWTLHDMNPFTGGCHHSDGCLLFRNNCMPCFQLEGTIDDNFAGKMLELKVDSMQRIEEPFLKIVTPSKWLGNLSSTSKLFGKYFHSVIPNAIDSNKIQMISKEEARKKLGIESEKKIIFVNSHHIDNPRKGLSFLVDALNLLPPEKYLVIAAGHKMGSDLFSNLFYLGYIQSEEKLSLAFSAADVFVLPSLAENFPNTICESLLCGTPVVAFNTGGIPELINSGNGMVVSLRDSNELAAAIEKVTSKTWDRNLIRQNAIAVFGMSRVSSEYIKVYNQLIE